MKHIRPLVKYHGGKGRLHQWCLSYFVPHKIYVEPFGGAASVLLNKTIVPNEIYNELEKDMFNLMHQIKYNFDAFMNKINTIRYSEETFLKNKKLLEDNFDPTVDRAICFYVVKRMSRGGLGLQFSWSERIYSTGPAEIHCWNTAIQNIFSVKNRINHVTLKNDNAFDLIPQFLNDSNCLMYLDPPYLTSTRVFKKAYKHEFDITNHEQLLNMIHSAKAKIILSGYDSDLYKKWLYNWTKVTKDVANHSSQIKEKTRKNEVLWMNYTPSIKS